MCRLPVTVHTLFGVVDDVLAQQVIVAENHRGAQRGEMLLHPHHLLLQHSFTGTLLLDSG